MSAYDDLYEIIRDTVDEFIRTDIRYGVEHQRHMPDSVKAAHLRGIIHRKLVPEILKWRDELDEEPFEGGVDYDG